MSPCSLTRYVRSAVLIHVDCSACCRCRKCHAAISSKSPTLPCSAQSATSAMEHAQCPGSHNTGTESPMTHVPCKTRYCRNALRTCEARIARLPKVVVLQRKMAHLWDVLRAVEDACGQDEAGATCDAACHAQLQPSQPPASPKMSAATCTSAQTLALQLHPLVWPTARDCLPLCCLHHSTCWQLFRPTVTLPLH